MPFQKGHKLAKGGKREGSGRPPDEFKQKCIALANSPEMMKWLADVIEGREVVDPDIRLKAWDRLCDRAYGKPAQTFDDAITSMARTFLIRANANTNQASD